MKEEEEEPTQLEVALQKLNKSKNPNQIKRDPKALRRYIEQHQLPPPRPENEVVAIEEAQKLEEDANTLIPQKDYPGMFSSCCSRCKEDNCSCGCVKESCLVSSCICVAVLLAVLIIMLLTGNIYGTPPTIHEYQSALYKNCTIDGKPITLGFISTKLDTVAAYFIHSASFTVELLTKNQFAKVGDDFVDLTNENAPYCLVTPIYFFSVSTNNETLADLTLTIP